MSHRRESGAIPPWVVPEPTPRKSTVQSDIHSNNSKNVTVLNAPPDQKSMASRNAQEKQVGYGWGDMSENKATCDQSSYVHIIGGRIVNHDFIQKADLLVKDGKIESVGKNLDVPPNIPTLDASGLMVMPGGVDNGTYILNDIFGFEPNNYTQTTKEALLGGTTTIIDTVICPKGQLPVEVLCKQKRRVEDAKRWCNVVYRVGLLELNEAVVKQMETLVKVHHVTSFVFFTSTSKEGTPNVVGINPIDLRQALQRCRELGAVAILRSTGLNPGESDVVAPTVAQEAMEVKNTELVIQLAETTNCPLLVASPTYVKTVELTVKAHNRIPPVHVYVSCAPSTLLPVAGINGLQCTGKFLSHLTAGDIVAISSDQAGTSNTTGSARLGAVGQRLVAVWESSVPSGWQDALGFVGLVSTNAARYAGLYPVKGRISPGSDADLVLWPSNALTESGVGRPTMVLLQGCVMARDGKLAHEQSDADRRFTVDGATLKNVVEPAPMGEILHPEPFPMAIYSAIIATDRLRKRYQSAGDKEPWEMGALAKEVAATTAPTGKAADDHCATSTAADVYKPAATTVPEPSETISVRMIHGHRDLHASGFSLSGAQVDDNRPQRSGIRTSQPPGGQSRNPLW